MTLELPSWMKGPFQRNSVLDLPDRSTSAAASSRRRWLLISRKSFNRSPWLLMEGDSERIAGTTRRRKSSVRSMFASRNLLGNSLKGKLATVSFPAASRATRTGTVEADRSYGNAKKANRSPGAPPVFGYPWKKYFPRIPENRRRAGRTVRLLRVPVRPVRLDSSRPRRARCGRKRDRGEFPLQAVPQEIPGREHRSDGRFPAPRRAGDPLGIPLHQEPGGPVERLP